MKRFIIILIVSVLIGKAALAQGWERQTSPTTNNLNAVVFVDTSSGWAVGGDFGTETILHTTDGGAVWTVQTAVAQHTLRNVDFVDASHGWAVGGDYGVSSIGGVALRTTDGGTTWTISDTLGMNVLLDVSFVDTNNGWAVGSGWYEWNCFYIIRHTTDGGATWVTQDSGAGATFNAVKFTNANNGWVVGALCSDTTSVTAVMHTTDGGATWSSDSVGYSPNLNDIDFVDDNHGWVVGSRPVWPVNSGPFISRTTDGGATWTVLDSLGQIPKCVDFLDANHGWALYGYCFSEPLIPIPHTITGIMRSSDGGEVWNSELNTHFYGECHPELLLSALDFVDPIHGWAVGNNGQILRYNPTLGVPNERGVVSPSTYCLSSYPNPFNSSTTISYELPKAGNISLRVFNVLGREVAMLKDGFVEAGTHHVTFDGTNLASGVYFARLDAGLFSQTKKLMLLK